MNISFMMYKILPAFLQFGAFFLVMGWSVVWSAEPDCRRDCPPRDDREFLQSILDACRINSICEFPTGVFTIDSPLQISKSIKIRGAGGGPRKKPHKRVTEIRVAEGVTSPAFVIQGDRSDIDVHIRDLAILAGGIHVGGQKDPCRGIDDPFDLFQVNLTLSDLTIQATALDSIFFEGESLTLQDVKVEGNIEGTGLYVANATGDVVIIDGQFVDNDRWGIYVCNNEGTGQVFINDVAASQNGRGGIAIVGKGSPPNLKTVCMQNTGTAFNFRFGILLFDVVKTLLFNVTAGFTFSEPDGHFGDGIAVSSSDDVLFWDVTASLNNRSGFFVYGPSAAENTHVHLVGDVQSLNNGIIAAVEGDALFDPHNSQTIVSGVCGGSFIAPPVNTYCEEGFVQVNCHAVPVTLGAPDPAP